MPLAAELGALSADAGSEGALLLGGRREIASTLTWSDERAEKLGRLVDALCDPLLKAGRVLDSLYLEFDKSALMVVTLGPWRLVQIVGAGEHPLSRMQESAAAFLARNEERLKQIPGVGGGARVPATVQVKPARATSATAGQSADAAVGPAKAGSPAITLVMLRDMLTSRLAMVMGRKSADTLVGEAISTAGMEPDAPIDAGAALQIVAKLLEKVPHRAKREALLHEITTLLKPAHT